MPAASSRSEHRKTFYERPNSEFVARFIGGSNVINATHLSGHRVEVAGHTLDIGQGNFADTGER